MGTLYVDRKEIRIKLDGNALAFYENGERVGTAPIVPLKRVVVVGLALIETPVLHRLAREGVGVLFLSGKRLRFSGRLYGESHSNARLRVRQYQKTLDRQFALLTAKDLVTRKVSAQRELLADAMEKRPELRLELFTAHTSINEMLPSIEDTCEVDVLRGLEGSAAAQYFGAFVHLFPPSLGFSKRVKRPPGDPVNALLSLGYTMLHFEIAREIELIGLDPVLGFLHQFDYGRESLACDLVEPYRPAVDRWTWELFRDRTFTDRDFTEGDERPGCYLKKEARRRYYELYEAWAGQQRSLWTEEARRIARSINDGEDPVPEGEQRIDGEEGRAVALDS